MKFDHKVKYNGKWYMSFEEIPEQDSKQKPSCNRTEIIRMSVAELKNFAAEQGISDTENMTGAELKKVLIEKLGL